MYYSHLYFPSPLRGEGRVRVKNVIPVPLYVIPVPLYVIPAQAGIHLAVIAR